MNEQNNKGLLALKLNKAMGEKNVSQLDIAKAVDLSQATISEIMRGKDTASLRAYNKVAEYLGVSIRPEKSLVTKPHFSTLADVEPALTEKYLENMPKKLTKEDIVQAEKETQDEMKRQFCGSTEIASEEENVLTVRWKKGTSFPHEYFGKDPSVTLPAPIVQNEFTRWQAWVVIALQVVVILFLIFPVK